MLRPALTLALLTFAAAAQAAPLYLNGPVVDGPVVDGTRRSVLTSPATLLGLGAQTTANNAVADNFVVPLGETWSVQSLSFFAYQTNSGGHPDFTFTDANWSIVTGAVAGPVLSSGTAPRVTNEGFVGYRVTNLSLGNTTRPIFQIGVDIPDIDLTAGEYWVRWSLAGTGASGPSVPQTSDARTGDARQSVAGGSFNLAIDSGSDLTVELPFAVNGVIADPTGTVPESGSLALVLAGGLAALSAKRRRRAA